MPDLVKPMLGQRSQLVHGTSVPGQRRFSYILRSESLSKNQMPAEELCLTLKGTNVAVGDTTSEEARNRVADLEPLAFGSLANLNDITGKVATERVSVLEGTPLPDMLPVSAVFGKEVSRKRRDWPAGQAYGLRVTAFTLMRSSSPSRVGTERSLMTICADGCRTTVAARWVAGGDMEDDMEWEVERTAA